MCARPRGLSVRVVRVCVCVCVFCRASSRRERPVIIHCHRTRSRAVSGYVPTAAENKNMRQVQRTKQRTDSRYHRSIASIYTTHNHRKSGVSVSVCACVCTQKAINTEHTHLKHCVNTRALNGARSIDSAAVVAHKLNTSRTRRSVRTDRTTRTRTVTYTRLLTNARARHVHTTLHHAAATQSLPHNHHSRPDLNRTH